jgi:Protein of unknown function (DUF2752)
MLILCSLAIATAPLLTVLPDERVSVWCVKSLVLPPTCMSREIFGTTCPACGLTRSFVYIAHGEWSDSLRVNRIGWIVMALTVLQIPYRAHALWGSGRMVLGPVASKCFALTVIAVIVGSWLIGLLLGS